MGEVIAVGIGGESSRMIESSVSGGVTWARNRDSGIGAAAMGSQVTAWSMASPLAESPEVGSAAKGSLASGLTKPGVPPAGALATATDAES
jgi:hypothetical protein